MLQNALIALIGLGSVVPAPIDYYLGTLIEIVHLDLFNAEEHSDKLFKFSKTEPYNAQTEQARFETRTCILNAGDIFYFLIVYIVSVPVGILISLS